MNSSNFLNSIINPRALKNVCSQAKTFGTGPFWYVQSYRTLELIGRKKSEALQRNHKEGKMIKTMTQAS
jgi:hypothetical protein